MTRSALLLAALVLVVLACGCRRTTAPNTDPPSIAIKVPPDLASASIHQVHAVDDERAVLLAEVGGPMVALARKDGAVWAIRPPCDPEDLSNVAITAGPDVVTVRCKVVPGGTLETLGVRTDSGVLAWTSEKITREDQIGMASIQTIRRGSVIVESIRWTDVVARDAGSGKVLWKAAPSDFLREVGADHVLLDEYTKLSARRLADGVTLFEAPASKHCGTVGDRVFVLRTDGIAAYPLKGAPELVAPSALLEPRMVRCGVRDGDLIVVFDFEKIHNAVISRFHDQKRVASAQVKELSWPLSSDGWDRPLPRYLPLIGWAGSDIHVYDLDRMEEQWTVTFPPLASAAGGAILAVRARQGDRFLLSKYNKVLALEGDRGTFVASDTKYAETFWWLDMDRGVAGRTVWAPREGHLIEPVVLGDDNAFAKTLARTTTTTPTPTTTKPAPNELSVVARLVDTGGQTPHCGTFHFIRVMRYAIVRVESGTYAAKELYVAQDCPELTRAQFGDAGTLMSFRVGDTHHLVLRREPSAEKTWLDGFSQRELPRYHALRTDPVMP